MFSNIISIVSAIFALLSVLISFYIYKASRTDTSYLDIDKQYGDLLSIGLSDPDLRDYDMTSTFYKLDHQSTYKKKYNIYAYMCWNLVETIFDRQKDKNGAFQVSDTWLPVIFEENRLHYTWFKHNLRLFKPEFQVFVTSKLNDIDILEGNLESLNLIYDRFKDDFASEEILDYSQLKKLMLEGNYKLYLAKHKVFKEIIGYAFIYELGKQKAIWLDYMSIAYKFQNAGYGTLLFNKIIEMKQEGIVGMYMEVEIPDVKNENLCNDQKRRIRFYERLGAQRMNFDYIFPNNNGGLPMYLYFRPSPNIKMLPKKEVKEAVSAIFENIHYDVYDSNKIKEKFIDSIPDHYYH